MTVMTRTESFTTYIVVFLLAVLVFSCHPVPADEHTDFDADVAWIEANSGLRWEGTNPPRLSEIPLTTLENLCGKGCVGTYDPYSHIVFLAMGLDPVTRRTTLFHEHVHVLQYSRKHVPNDTCPGLLEPLAYDLEERWSHEHGHPFTGDKFEGFMARSRCDTFER